MPKPRRAIRPIMKNISLPEDIVARVELHLYSDLEGRVPHGAWARLMEGLLKEWLSKVEAQTPTGDNHA